MTQRSTWATGPLLGFDTETSGINVNNDFAVTISLVHIAPGREPDTHEWMIDPGDKEIPASATEVHKITTEYAREHGVPAEQAWGEAWHLMNELWTPQTPLVAYNGSFDVSLADRELDRYFGLAVPFDAQTGLFVAEDAHRYLIDPMVIGIANQQRPRPKGKGAWKLGNACHRYGVALPEDKAHNSTEDTLATCRLAYKMAALWPGSVGYASLESLHNRQRGWRREWCLNMGQWLEGQALKMERAWASGNPAYVRDQFAYLKNAGYMDAATEVCDETVAAECAGTRERAASFTADASAWPMRLREAVAA